MATSITSEEFNFVIEDVSIEKIKLPTKPRTDKLSQAIYNHCNKLIEGQSFFIGIKEFRNCKSVLNKISTQYNKIKEFYKNNGKTVAFKTRIVKNETGEILGYRIGRLTIKNDSK